MLEDSDLDAVLVQRELARSDLSIAYHRVSTRRDYTDALRQGAFDLILSDFSLPDFDGVEALDLARQLAPEAPFIFVSGVVGEEFAIESLKEGATDYVLKQRLERLPSAVRRALNEARERRDRRRAEERMTLLVAELSHRVKNTLATVAAISRLTLRQSSSLQAFDEAFTRRLQALSTAHSLIFQANWGETDLSAVVEQALHPFRRGGEAGFRISGEPVKLSPKAALALTLMLHELATNATKYGALTTEDGQVDLHWTITAQEPAVLDLTWSEHGGPPVTTPTRKGFGHTLIERSVRYELDGTAKLTFPPEGMSADIHFPLV
jgi:two-component sensor histidine kinase/CheY-like chemotaxis protein